MTTDTQTWESGEAELTFYEDSPALAWLPEPGDEGRIAIEDLSGFGSLTDDEVMALPEPIKVPVMLYRVETVAAGPVEGRPGAARMTFRRSEAEPEPGHTLLSRFDLVQALARIRNTEGPTVAEFGDDAFPDFTGAEDRS